MKHLGETNMIKIAVIPGDGIGKEVIASALEVVKAAKSIISQEIAFEEFDYGASRFLKDGTTIPQDDLIRLKKDFHAVFLGALGDPRVSDVFYMKEILLKLRFDLDLYINFRPFKLYGEDLCPLKGIKSGEIDFVLFRENTEGCYVQIGGEFKKNTEDEIALHESIHSRKGVERIIRAAFEYAGKNRKKKVLMTDKHNALTHTHGLWQRVFREVGEEYPDIRKEHLLMDVCAMEMVRNPKRFEVIVTDNLFGDILSDLAAQIVGGLGLAPSGNINPGKISMFEPVHGSAPDIAGKGIANPMGAVLSAALMLDFLGENRAAKAIENAVSDAINNGFVTGDLRGSKNTEEVTEYIIGRLR
jgi:3-isopropylmalate dehydrogenase